MTKFEASTESIECGNKILEMIYPMLIEFDQNKGYLSKMEQETYNTMLGSQFALICEYYLKGLLIPNIQVEIPEELKDKITSLSEEQELMIIVADEEKIKTDPILGKLDRKQLRLLLGSNSLKSLGHSLICLLGTKTMPENKEIHLPDNLRRHIVRSLKGKLYDTDIKDLEGYVKFKKNIQTPINGNNIDDKLDNGDAIIEEEISKSSVSDAFPKGRYGIFDGFVSNIDWISELAFSIRDEIKHQYPNLIEVFKCKREKFGKFIYPDEETLISVENIRGEKAEYEMVPTVLMIDGITEVLWNASKTTVTDEDKKILEVLRKYNGNARVSSKKVYLEDTENGELVKLEYIQNSQRKQIKLIDGRLYEMSPNQISKEENSGDTHEER